MKILQVSSFFKPSWESGGVARYCYSISRKLVEMGHEVTVFTTNGYRRKLDVKTNERTMVDGIETFYFSNAARSLFKYAVVPTPWKLPTVGYRRIKDFDIVHIHGHRTLLAVVTVALADWYDVPYVVHAHGSLPYETGNSQLKRVFDFSGGNNMLFGAQWCFALTPKEVSQYKSVGVDSDSIAVVPNGVQLNEFDPDRPATNSSDSDSDFKFLFLGRLNERKGLENLIAAFEMLDQGQLIIAGGDDGFKEKLELILQDSTRKSDISVLGYVPEDQKQHLFAEADAFVLPSTGAEGLPTTILEAAASGLPLLVSTKCHAEFVTQSDAGIVVEPTQSDLKLAMESLMSNEKKSVETGLRARDMVENSFNWNIIINGILQAYAEAVD